MNTELPINPAAKVEQMLVTAGWERAGVRHIAGDVARIPGNRFVAARWSSRDRWRKGNRRVTVGGRTTCFYEVENRQACRFVNYASKDIDGIRAEIEKGD